MPTPYSIHYHFSQGFSFSAQAAYLQCTDFTSQDPALTSEDNANTSNSTLIARLQRTSQVQTSTPNSSTKPQPKPKRFPPRFNRQPYRATRKTSPQDIRLASRQPTQTRLYRAMEKSCPSNSIHSLQQILKNQPLNTFTDAKC